MRATLGVELESGGIWPTQPAEHRYRGRLIKVLPETEHLAPSISLELKAAQRPDDGLKVLHQFLSAVAYANDVPILVTQVLGGQLAPGRGLRKSPFVPPKHTRDSLGFVPETEDRRALLALALYREALTLNSCPFSFLSLFKVINVIATNRRDQISWLDKSIRQVRDANATHRLAELKSHVGNVGEYLYKQGRCAVAHASPLGDPDDPQHIARLGEDLPLMKALARIAIEADLGVPRQVNPWVTGAE